MKPAIFLILTKRTQKLISIFEYLTNEKKWHKIPEISLAEGFSVRSTQRYLNELFDEIAEYNKFYGDNIEILFNKNNGVRLTIEKGMSSFWRFARFIIIKDKTYELTRSVFFHTFESPMAFATKHHLSLATVESALKKCSLFCKHTGLSFSTTTYKVDGDEQSIRIVLYSITWFLNRGIFWPETYRYIDENKLHRQIDELTTKMNVTMIPSRKRKLAYFIATNLIRINQKKQVNMDPEWSRFFDNKVFGILNIVRTLYSNYHIYDEAEIFHLATYWQSEIQQCKSADIKHDVIATHRTNQSVVYQMTLLFCETFSKEFGPFSRVQKKEIFQSAFFTHLNCFIYKINDYYSFDSEFLEKAPVAFPHLIKKMATLIDTLYSLTQNKLFKNKEILLRAYLHIYASVSYLLKYEPTIFLYLETDLPFTEEQYIKNYILSFFQTSFNLLFIDNSIVSPVDLILSSVPIDVPSDYCVIKTTSNFQTPITHRSMQSIERQLTAILNRHS